MNHRSIFAVFNSPAHGSIAHWPRHGDTQEAVVFLAEFHFAIRKLRRIGFVPHIHFIIGKEDTAAEDCAHEQRRQRAHHHAPPAKLPFQLFAEANKARVRLGRFHGRLRAHLRHDLAAFLAFPDMAFHQLGGRGAGNLIDHQRHEIAHDPAITLFHRLPPSLPDKASALRDNRSRAPSLRFCRTARQSARISIRRTRAA